MLPRRMVRTILLAAALCACSPAGDVPAQSTERTVTPAIEVSTPLGGAVVSSPLRVEGIAPNTWYYEAVFSAELRNADGRLIAEAPAQAQGDWMQPGSVPFVVVFNFAVPAPRDAEIVLIEDMTGEDRSAPRELRIPVILSPGGN